MRVLLVVVSMHCDNKSYHILCLLWCGWCIAVVWPVGRWRLRLAGRQLVSLLEWRRALWVSWSRGLVWWIEKYFLIRKPLLCHAKGRIFLRLWEIHVTFLCPNYLLLLLRETCLLSGLIRKITWLVLRIARPSPWSDYSI